MTARLGVSSGQQAIEARTDEELTRLITQFTNEITWQMNERGLTRADLAGRMGVSPGRVSQVLSGGENLTLRTLASLSVALDAQFEVELKVREPVTESSAAGQGVADAAEPATARERPSPRADRFEEAAASRAFPWR
jgi:transcriptional regulator with XRE-family HTH domain